MMRKKILYSLLLILIILSVFLLYGTWENQNLQLTSLTIADDALPDAFDGFRIAHISDLHNAVFGEDNGRLLALLEETSPDIIALTGDMVDSFDPHIEQSLSFLQRAAQIAPCYYVTGNHEARIPDYPAFQSALEEMGIEVLQGESVMLDRRGQSIRILGVDDYLFLPGEKGLECVMAGLAQLEALDRSGYDIALYHRPELTYLLEPLDIELVFSGHAHGGQIRLPFLGGIIAPDQGFFPQFTSGRYDLDRLILVVSRGLGNSKFPVRINNPPEVVLITLECA